MRFTRAEELEMVEAMRAAHRAEIERYKDNSDYYPFSDLWKERGWSKGLIRDLLGEPDDTQPNPRYKTGPHRMRLYAKVRVHAAERDPRFIEHQARRQKRGVGASGNVGGERRPIASQSPRPVSPDDAPTSRPPETITERAAYIWQRTLERESRAAELTKAHHGYQCQACDMTFSEVYGEIGSDFIEAHHLVPLADIEPGAERTYTPGDFAVLCSNCHRMIHRWPDRSNPKPWDLDGFRRMLRSRRGRGAR